MSLICLRIEENSVCRFFDLFLYVLCDCDDVRDVIRFAAIRRLCEKRKRAGNYMPEWFKAEEMGVNILIVDDSAFP